MGNKSAAENHAVKVRTLWLLILVCLTGWPRVLGLEFPSKVNRLVVWNVGQGLWVTLILQKECLHFDSGGEFSAITRVQQQCTGKQNYHILSHFDWDHLSFASALASKIPLCRFGAPEYPAANSRVLRYLKIPVCTSAPQVPLKQLALPQNGKSKKTNDLSRIFMLRDSILFPGDSPIAQEKYWSRQINKQIQILILGHHGSRTSTGKDLLADLSPNTVAIASAKKAKYGHPHPEVERRLREKNLRVLSTENWGNIWIEIPGN